MRTLSLMNSVPTHLALPCHFIYPPPLHRVTSDNLTLMRQCIRKCHIPYDTWQAHGIYHKAWIIYTASVFNLNQSVERCYGFSFHACPCWTSPSMSHLSSPMLSHIIWPVPAHSASFHFLCSCCHCSWTLCLMKLTLVLFKSCWVLLSKVVFILQPV